MVTISIMSCVCRSQWAYFSHLIIPAAVSVDLLHCGSTTGETKLLVPFENKTLYLINEAGSITFLVWHLVSDTKHGSGSDCC